MAEITFAMGTSHAPITALPTRFWDRSKTGDTMMIDEIHYDGKIYSYNDLLELRGSDHLTAGNSPEQRQKNFNRIQKCLEVLGKRVREAQTDVLVVIGDDHYEFFGKDVQPAFFVYTGEAVLNPGFDPDAFEGEDALRHIRTAMRPRTDGRYPVQQDLATAIAASVNRDGIDVTVSDRAFEDQPPGTRGIGHSVGFVYNRVLGGLDPIPLVPILMNTYFPPNQPTARRCFEFGQAIGRAIRQWDRDKKVGIVASGGLTHFAVDEKLDTKVIDAMKNRDADALISIPEEILQSGTSEIKNWIATLGVLWETNLEMDLIDYVPAYRSEGGTGVGAAFATWS